MKTIISKNKTKPFGYGFRKAESKFRGFSFIEKLIYMVTVNFFTVFTKRGYSNAKRVNHHAYRGQFNANLPLMHRLRGEFRRRFGEFWVFLVDVHDFFAGLPGELGEVCASLVNLRLSGVGINESAKRVRKVFPAVSYGIARKNTAAPKLIFLLAITRASSDFIPREDALFDEWQKNFVKKLGNPWPPIDDNPPGSSVGAAAAPAMVLYAYLGITLEDYNELLSEQRLWTDDFARGNKEADRKKSETGAKNAARKRYEKFLRDFVAENIRSNKKASARIKLTLGLTVPDTTHTLVHPPFTDMPYFTITPLGGGKVRYHVRPTKDSKRASMLKGAMLEVAYVILLPDEPRPVNVDDMFEQYKNAKSFISTKAIFIQSCGANNAAKYLFAACRWVDLKNPSRNGPWSGILSTVIA